MAKTWADELEGYANKIQAIHDKLDLTRDVVWTINELGTWLVLVRKRVEQLRAKGK